MAQSYINAARQFDFELRIACPEGYEPNAELLAANAGRVSLLRDPREAADPVTVGESARRVLVEADTELAQSRGTEGKQADAVTMIRLTGAGSNVESMRERMVVASGATPKKTPPGEPQKWRVVVDLRPTNAFCRPRSCKYETLRSLRRLARKGDWMVSWDISDGYHAVGVRADHRRRHPRPRRVQQGRGPQPIPHGVHQVDHGRGVRAVT